MADNVAITAGTGTTIGTDDVAGVQIQRVKTTWGPDGTANDTDVASGKPMPVQLRTATGTATPLPALGTAGAAAADVITVQGIASGTTIPVTASLAAAQTLATVTTVGTVSAITTLPAMTRNAGATDAGTLRVTVDNQQVAALGQAAMAASMPVTIASNQSGLANRAFSVAFTTLTRPANQTAYGAGESISDNATAGSVTALSATISDINDDPIFISEILINSTDTGLAGKKIRAYLFNSDPTASSGVGGGDNATYAQKKAGYIGSFMGWLETGFSDGTVGRLIPTFNETNNSQAGGFVVTKPTSGAKTLYIQYQAVEVFTPSANSTTIIGTARGWQGRAA